MLLFRVPITDVAFTSVREAAETCFALLDALGEEICVKPSALKQIHQQTLEALQSRVERNEEVIGLMAEYKIELDQLRQLRLAAPANSKKNMECLQLGKLWGLLQAC